MKCQSLRRKFVVELFDQRLERRALEPQAKLGNATHRNTEKVRVTPSHGKRKIPKGEPVNENQEHGIAHPEREQTGSAIRASRCVSANA